MRCRENSLPTVRLTMALGAQYGFTGSFEPSQDIAVALRNLSGAIGGFQGVLETSEENEMWQEPPIKPDLSGRDSSLSSASSPGVPHAVSILPLPSLHGERCRVNLPEGSLTLQCYRHLGSSSNSSDPDQNLMSIFCAVNNSY